MRRLAAMMAAAIAVTGCGVRPTGPIDAGEAPTAEATALPESTLYFVRSGMLVPVTRSVSPWDGQAVFDTLLAGPTAAERAHGLSTGLAGVGGIQVVPAVDGKMTVGKGEMIMLRLRLTAAASVRGPLGLDSKTTIEQLACTSQSLATHPFMVELLPVDYAATGAQPISASCDRFADPIPPAG